MDTLLTVLHVVGAVFIVGPMAILPQTAMRAVRSGQAGQVQTLTTSTTIFTWLSLIVFALGFGVMGMSDPKYHVAFADTWIWLSAVCYVIAFLLTMFLVIPTMRRAAVALGGADAAGAGDSGATNAEAAKPGYAAIAAGSGIASLLLLVVVILMVWKP